RHAWFEPTDDREEMARAPARVDRVELEGRPDLGLVVAPGREGVARRHDADHGVRLRVDLDRLPDDLPLAPESPPPEAVRDHGDAGAARAVLLWGEAAAERRPDA